MNRAIVLLGCLFANGIEQGSYLASEGIECIAKSDFAECGYVEIASNTQPHRSSSLFEY
ncbi:hypothetical protein [Aerosakkonema funiforme]|uniref:Uncharacterized protein n=1 Tax=Aerosakkonema funiforme FACHB-1375 TaxID=2949571 RepID=A0A926VI05_9CYAN|nr:hypothetical protein [Aerosakkonema funiforme]MBD2183057.1 hypothetical protein [Aerosakkonema funiforme FACHB-1375]